MPITENSGSGDENVGVVDTETGGAGRWVAFEWPGPSKAATLWVSGIQDEVDLLTVIDKYPFIKVVGKAGVPFYLNTTQVLAFRITTDAP